MYFDFLLRVLNKAQTKLQVGKKIFRHNFPFPLPNFEKEPFQKKIIKFKFRMFETCKNKYKIETNLL